MFLVLSANVSGLLTGVYCPCFLHSVQMCQACLQESTVHVSCTHCKCVRPAYWSVLSMFLVLIANVSGLLTRVYCPCSLHSVQICQTCLQESTIHVFCIQCKYIRPAYYSLLSLFLAFSGNMSRLLTGVYCPFFLHSVQICQVCLQESTVHVSCIQCKYVRPAYKSLLSMFLALSANASGLLAGVY